MNVLAIDTSLEEMGLALSMPAGRLWTVTVRIGLKHSEALLPWVRRLLEEAGIGPRDLNLLVCSTGPGSFTGLRIGLATARGLARGAGCPLTGASTLDALAWRHRGFEGTVVAVVDARKGRSYSALFRKGERVSEYLDLSLADLARRLIGSGTPEAAAGLLLTGPMSGQLQAVLDGRRTEATPGTAAVVEPLPDAGILMTDPAALLELGRRRFQRDPEEALRVRPLYIRKSEAEIHRFGGGSEDTAAP